MTKYYWVDGCESLDGWVHTTLSLSDTDPQNGNYCFRMYTTMWGANTRADKDIIPDVTLPSKFDFYYWLKVEHFTSADVFSVLLGLTVGSIGDKLYYLSESRFVLKNYNKDALGASISLNWGQWYLIRHEIEQIAGVVHNKLYIDGVYKYDTTKTWTFGLLNWFTLNDTLGGYDVYFDYFRIYDYTPISSVIDVIVDEVNLTEECVISTHYIKSHPNQDPDTFEIRLLPECGENIDYFDTVEIKKLGVTEFYGFVEEITPEVGEDGLEYLITGRCWKLIAWKKWNERFQESREVGPMDSEGNIESGFFGAVRPEELVKFVLRCPMSEHPKDKIRHKIGWGIPSDFWDCCANETAEAHYPLWVALRYTGLSWRGRGTCDNIITYNLDVKTFVNEVKDWTDTGAGDNPWIDSDSGDLPTVYIRASNAPTNQTIRYFTFEDFSDIPAVDPVTVSLVYLNVQVFAEGEGAITKVYLWDGINWIYVGIAYGSAFYGEQTRTFNVSSILNTITKVKNARVYFVRVSHTPLTVIIDHCYLTVYGSDPAEPADQRADDWFIVNLGMAYDDVTAMLIECRNNPTMYARHYNIQYTTLSNCCNDEYPVPEDDWNDFTPAIHEIDNEARDILHSWEPEDDVRCIRVKLTMSNCNAWEISQIYIWQADEYKYRLLDEGD